MMLHPTTWKRLATAAACCLALAAATTLVGCTPGDAEVLATARQHLDKREYETARVQLKGLLQKKPDWAEARLLLGRVMLATGDVAGAEAELRRALDAGEEEDKVVPPLVTALVAQGKGSLVISQFGNTTLKNDAAMAELKVQLATAQAQANDLDAAQQSLAVALHLVPDHPAGRLLGLRLLAARGSVDKAVEGAKALTQAQPKEAGAWSLYGDLLWSRKRGDEALAAWSEALKLQPDLPMVHAAIIAAQFARKDVPAAEKQFEAMKKALPKHPQTQYNEALMASAKGDFARTRELTQVLLRAAPDNLRLLLLAGEAELKLGSLAQAEALFGRAVQIAPKLAVARRMLAQTYYQGNQPAKALSALQPLLESNPPDADALALAGQAQIQQGDSKAAGSAFSKAAQAKPDDTRFAAARALSRLGQGNDAAALTELEQLAAKDKGARVDLALVATRLRLNDVPGALKAVENIAKKQPDQPLADHLRGRILSFSGDRAAARANYEKALARRPNFLPTLAGLAELDLAEQQFDAARKRFTTLLQTEPNNAGAMLALSDVANRAGKPAEAQEWLDKAIKASPDAPLPRLAKVDQLLAARQTEAANSAAQAAVAALPDNAELRERLGRAEMLAGQPQQAASTFSKLAALQPKAVKPQLLLVEAHTAAGNSVGATAALRKAQELAPDAPAVIAAAAQMALRERKGEQAVRHARRLQQLKPKEPQGYLLEGDVEAAQQHWAEAAAAYRKALALPGAHGDLPGRLHTALRAGGKTAEADKFGEDWLRSNPDDAMFAVHLGDVAMAAQNPAEAEKRYRAVLQKAPDNTLALNNLAYLLCSQKKPGGTELADKAVKLAPVQPAFLDTQASCLAADNQPAKAVAAQQQAVKLAPDVPGFRLALARYQLAAGDKGAARTELRALGKLGDKFPQRKEVDELLKAAGG